jgi:tRNA 2-thiocytidine biosynthesis protein TtcA
MDGKCHDFKGIKPTGVASDDGDRAFDPEEFPMPTGLPTVQVLNLRNG